MFYPNLHAYFAAHAPITLEDAMLMEGIPSGYRNKLGEVGRLSAVLRRLARMRAEYATEMVKAMEIKQHD